MRARLAMIVLLAGLGVATVACPSGNGGLKVPSVPEFTKPAPSMDAKAPKSTGTNMLRHLERALQELDPDFWGMLTPQGREALGLIGFWQSPEPCEVLPGHPYIGGVWEGATRTVRLCAVPADMIIEVLRHEVLHVLDAAGGQPDSQENGFWAAVTPDLEQEAEEMYLQDAPHGWFRPGELYAMIPIVVDWQWCELPSVVLVYYDRWFTDASACPPTEAVPTQMPKQGSGVIGG